MDGLALGTTSSMGHGRHGIRIRWTGRRRLESFIPGQVVWLPVVGDIGDDSRSFTVRDVSRAEITGIGQ